MLAWGRRPRLRPAPWPGFVGWLARAGRGRPARSRGTAPQTREILMPRLVFALLFVGCVSGAPAFGPADMLRIVSFADESQPVISPAGDWVAYATVDGSDQANI